MKISYFWVLFFGGVSKWPLKRLGRRPSCGNLAAVRGRVAEIQLVTVSCLSESDYLSSTEPTFNVRPPKKELLYSATVVLATHFVRQIVVTHFVGKFVVTHCVGEIVVTHFMGSMVVTHFGGTCW